MIIGGCGGIMKRVVAVLSLVMLVASFSACNKQAEDNPASEEESVVQSYTGAIYTARTEYEDGTYALRDYREDGTIAAEKLYNGNFLKAESFYDITGQIVRQVDYKQNGDVISETEYAVKGGVITAKSYDKDGKYTGKTVSSVNAAKKIERKAAYNDSDVLNSEDYYRYDANNRLIQNESISYDNNIACLTIIQNFDPESGAVLTEEAVQYTPWGDFILHEIYEYDGDDIKIVEKYDASGNPLPIEQ